LPSKPAFRGWRSRSLRLGRLLDQGDIQFGLPPLSPSFRSGESMRDGFQIPSPGVLGGLWFAIQDCSGLTAVVIAPAPQASTGGSFKCRLRPLTPAFSAGLGGGKSPVQRFEVLSRANTSSGGPFQHEFAAIHHENKPSAQPSDQGHGWPPRSLFLLRGLRWS